MKSVFDDYKLDKRNTYLYFLPIERFTLYKKEKIGDVTIYPSGYLDIEEMLKNNVLLGGGDNRGKQLTILQESVLVVFSDNAFHEYSGNVLSNSEIIRKSYARVSCVADYIRFKYCKLNDPASLPSRIGQVSTGDSLVLMFNGIGSPFTRVINEQIFVSTLTKGNGLNVKECSLFKDFRLFDTDLSETGHIAKSALEMYSSALEENTATGKFIQIIRLFEFIANPASYEKFQNVRQSISAHVAKNIYDIHRLSSEFKYYSSGDNQNGLRTEIIHNGKTIEELIPSESERESLFVKLQGYIHSCINDLLRSYNKPWSYIESLRNDKSSLANSNKKKENVQEYSSTIVIVDGSSLNEAIYKYHQMYADVHPSKPLESISIFNLCYQILANTRKLEKDKTIGFIIFYYDIHGFHLVHEDFDKLNGVELISKPYEFQIHTFKCADKDDLVEQVSQAMLEMKHNRDIHNDVLSKFESIILCGDRLEYVAPLTEMITNGNMDITLIKDAHYSEMDVDLVYFDIGHLVGMSLGLSADEL
jgi:Ca2+-binding EF-hand superfamily protein